MEEILLAGSETASWVLKDYGFLLDCAHFTFALIGIKKKLGKTAQQQPMMSFILSYLACFLSGILVNFLCQVPVLSGMKSTSTNGTIILLWWLMNFAMPNVFDSIVNFPIVLPLLLAAKELLRCKKIYSAVDKSIAAYDSSFFLAVLIGTCGACGGGFINHAIASLSSKTVSQVNHKTAAVTKFTFAFAILHTIAGLGIELFPSSNFAFHLTRQNLIFVQTAIMAPIMIGAKFGYELDPFKPIQDVASEVFIKMGRELDVKKKQ